MKKKESKKEAASNLEAEQVEGVVEEEVRQLNFVLPARHLQKWFKARGYVPDGGRLLGVGYDADSNSFLFRVEHESFPVVEAGKVIGRKLLEYE